MAMSSHCFSGATGRHASDRAAAPSARRPPVPCGPLLARRLARAMYSGHGEPRGGTHPRKAHRKGLKAEDSTHSNSNPTRPAPPSPSPRSSWQHGPDLAQLQLLQPLLSAVVAATTGRLQLLPPPLLAWLLRAASCAGHRPPSDWLTDAYRSLVDRLDELQPDTAAQAYLAITGLATGPGANPFPPPGLMFGLYECLERGAAGFTAPLRLDPRVALACLEAAAAAETGAQGIRNSVAAATAGGCATASAGAGPTAVAGNKHIGTPGLKEDAVASSSSGSYGGSSASQSAHDRRRVLDAPMPQSTVDALLRRVAGRALLAVNTAQAPPAGFVPGLSPSTVPAVAAAHALVASTRLVNRPSVAVVSHLGALVAEHSGAVATAAAAGAIPVLGALSGSGGVRGGGKQGPWLLLNALSALRALRAPPLPRPAASALITTLEALLPQLDAVQVSYAIAAVHDMSPESATAGATAFIRGPAVAALARGMVDLTSAPRLAAALTALPPPLRRPLPAELAAAAHDALRDSLAAADSDDLAEVLRRLGDADALPSYGWQGALAAEAGRRLQDAAAASLLSSQELCNTLFVLAALNYRPAFGWTASAAATLQPRLLTLTAAQLTNALWALAKFGHRSGDATWSAAAVQALQLQLPSLKPHQLSYGLGSLQRMGCHVGAAVLDEMLAAAAERLACYPPSDLVLLLMTVTRLRHVPSYAFTEAVTERLRPHLAATAVATADEDTAAAEAGEVAGLGPAGAAEPTEADVGVVVAPLTCQELASVGYALAKLHSRPEAEWMSAYMAACEARMSHFSADLLASLLWAVGELGQTPSPGWLSSCLAASRPQLGDFAPQDLVSLLSSLASLRAPPPADWLGEALTVLGARVGGLDGAGVAALLKALVDLDARVSNPDWYEAMCDQVSAFLPLLRPTELVDLLSSLAALGHSPGKEWLQRACAAALRVQASVAQQAQQQLQQQQAQARANGNGNRALGDSGAGSAALGGAVSYPAEAAAVNGSGGMSMGGRGGGTRVEGSLSQSQLEALVCALAKLGAEPPQPLLRAFFAASAPSLAAMPPQRLTATVSALAGARVVPEPAWLDALADAVRAGVMSYTFVQLDALTRGLAVFQGLVPDHKATRDLLSYLREFCLYG